MPSKRTTQDIIDIIESKYPNRYTVLSEYKNQKTKFRVRYNNCGCEKDVFIEYLLNGNSCLQHPIQNPVATERFIEKVKEKFGNEIVVLTKYNGRKRSILIWHSICKKSFLVKVAENILENKYVPCDCKKRKINYSRNRVSHDEFILRLENLFPGKYKVLSEYEKSNIPILIEHTSCGHSYEILPSTLMNSQGCKICYYKKIKTQEKFLLDLENKQKDRFVILGEYTGVLNPIESIDLRCGHHIYRKASELLIGHGCIDCFSPKKITHKEFLEKVNQLFPNKYIILEEFTTYDKNILIKYVDCECVRKVSPKTIMKGGNCIRHVFMGMGMKDPNEFENKIEELYPNRFEIIEPYSGINKKIKVRHIDCGDIFSTRAAYLLSVGSCTVCSMNDNSNGERIISEFLKSKNICFERQYKIKECKNIYPLPFDFGILKDNKLFALIEFQGQQHYSSLVFYSKFKKEQAEEKFKELQHRDLIKKEYCMNNNIDFLEISYKEIYSIRKIVNNFLCNLNYFD